MKRASWLLLLVLLSTTCTSTTFAAVRYTFTEQACKLGCFLSSSYGESDIVTNNNNDCGVIVLGNRTVVCAPSLGIIRSSSSSSHSNSGFGAAAAAVISQGPLEHLLSPVVAAATTSNTGIAFEFWLRPAVAAAVGAATALEEPILTIGTLNNLVLEGLQPLNSNNNRSTDAISPCDAGSYDFQLSVVDSTYWTATFRLSSSAAANAFAVFEPCRVMSFGNVTPGKLAHLVISLSDKRQAIYLNGQPAASVVQDAFDLNSWNLQDHGLHLLGYQRPFFMESAPSDFATDVTRSSATTLYQLTIYSKPILQGVAQGLLRQGLPSTPPFAYDQTVTVNEDAESVPGSHSIAWYRTATASPATDASPFYGPLVGSIDRDVQELIAASLLLIGENSTTALAKIAPVHVFITSLPEMGRLYFVDGTPLSVGNYSILIPVGAEPVHSLIYVPPHNLHSVGEDDAVTSFRYCIATSAAIFDVSQCESSATVQVHVVPVNDPPVALAVPMTVVVREGLDRDDDTAPKIPLLGSDVDAGDSIQQVQVTQPPAFGVLLLAVTTFRKDFLPHGTPLSNLNYLIRGDDPVRVKYIWRPDLARTTRVIQGTTTKDSFAFRVQDEQGLWSLEEKIEIQIMSAVSAGADPIVAFDEDLTGALHWWGMDDSGYDRRVGFFVEKIPPLEVGVLFDPVTNESLKVGATIKAFDAFPYRNGVLVPFQPTANYCHDKEGQLEYDAEIRFRVAAYADDAVVSVSDSISQQITVACVLDVISMTVPVASTSVLETSLERTTSDPCHGSVFNASSALDPSSCEAAAIINGIEVTSFDRKAETAFVSVLTRSGFLTFNVLYWNRTEPVFGRRVLASGRISFYAHPDDLTKIFSSLHFQSYIPGTDSIDFELQYGSCSKLEVAETPGSFKTSTCQVIRSSIAVDILRDDEKYKSKTRIFVGFPWQILFCLMVYPALYAAVILLEGTYAGDDDDDTVIEGSPIEPMERYIQHEDENGMFYYEDALDGTVRWDLPPGEDFVHFEEIGQ